MQVNLLVMSVVCAAVALPAIAEPDRDRGSRHHDRPEHRSRGIIVEPNIILERDRPASHADDPAFIMAELERCMAAGIRLFVDCLRHNHGSVMIRRLEACVQSESIPDAPARVAACLPLPAVQ